ncbi:hypothetical protein POTOM_056407 [Populus tomentosa]|uniref:Uncharacterized protein n=1 Tax=Populus tomentosa TaxID=118781 RepID=A0A8X7XYD2_POPTO|nr:hypothetical protein POTOM_056407 [Populus tomentosa]
MFIRSGSVWLLSGPPVPSQELNQGTLVKTWVPWLLELEGTAFSMAPIWPARSKLGVESRHPGEDLGVLAPRVEGHSVRLVSQSSDHLPLLAVEGLRAGAIWICMA